jgi:hypothetical protein
MVEVTGTVDVCCHRVHYRCDIGRMKLTDELKETLEREAEERAKDQINEDCGSGELNCLWKGEREIRGWWGIDKE